MGAVKKAMVNNLLIRRSKALGNTKRGLREVASDLVNDYAGGDPERLADLSKMTFLCKQTLERLSTLNDCESGIPYRPNCDTVERVLRAFNAEVYFKEVKITPSNQNQPKDDS